MWTREYAHHGEILQGVFQDEAGRPVRGLVTLPCRLFSSRARFLPDASSVVVVEPRWKWKASRVAELALAEWAEGRVGGRLVVRSTVPCGQGLGSSTSDVMASARAVAAALRVDVGRETLARIAVRAETASDPLMFGERAVLFAQREGRVIEDFGDRLPAMLVLGFRAGGAHPLVDTLLLPPADYPAADLARFEVLRGRLRRAIRDQDAAAVARVATESAQVNQQHLATPRHEQLERLVEDVGALGLQVAHSGTAVGLLFAPDDPQAEARIAGARWGLRRLAVTESWRFSVPADVA